jgi:hypothetical protein
MLYRPSQPPKGTIVRIGHEHDPTPVVTENTIRPPHVTSWVLVNEDSNTAEPVRSVGKVGDNADERLRLKEQLCRSP